jgi:esterase/lipase
MSRVALLLFMMMTATQAMARGPYEVSGVNSGFSTPFDRPYAEYIADCRAMIEAGRVDLTDATRDRIIAANTPFEIGPETGQARAGILLIHGLSDSPYQMNALAAHFAARGFLVRTLLLPGHGTVPGDLTAVSWTDWVRAAEYGAHRLAGRVDRLYVGGFSTGGALALHLALTQSDIAGIVLFAPAIGIRTPFAFLADTVLCPKWLLKQPETDYARYDSLPSHAVGQVYALTRQVNRLLSETETLTVPVFAALSDQDITVDSDRTFDVFRRKCSSDLSQMIVYTCFPDRFPPDASGRVAVVDSRVPQLRILSFSHMSLIVPPTDPHYGKDGDYVYSPHPLLRQDDKDVPPSEVYYGELLRSFKKRHHVRRLTWNPYFAEMLARIDRFVDRTLP